MARAAGDALVLPPGHRVCTCGSGHTDAPAAFPAGVSGALARHSSKRALPDLVAKCPDSLPVARGKGGDKGGPEDKPSCQESGSPSTGPT